MRSTMGHKGDKSRIAHCWTFGRGKQVFLHTDAAQSVGKAALAACMPWVLCLLSGVIVSLCCGCCTTCNIDRCRWMSNSLGQRWCTALSAICPEKLCIFLLIYPSAFQVHLSSQDVWSQGNWRLVCSTQAKGMTLSTFDVVIVFSIQRSQTNSKARFFLGNTHTHLAICIVWADWTTICIPLNCYCPLPKSSFSSCQSSFEVRLRPVIDGGGQERGMRSGTLATPPIVGFGAAAEVWIPSVAG